jgi:pilus assembly protein FimV
VRNPTITKRLLALAGLLILPLGATAAGLGKLTVLSGLGQPLRAEIEVVSLQRGEAESLAAKIASADAFREAGVEYGTVVPRVRSVLERRGDRYVIVLSTPQPVEEPFLDLLVELNWLTGRLVRQYTFLLDPSEYKGPTSIAAAPPKPAVAEVKPVETPTSPSVTATTPAAPITTAAPPPSAPAVAAAPATPAPRLAEPPSGEQHEVKRGDTLGKIAQQYKPEGVTTQQMLVALYRSNEDAFINKNMNLLRSGRTLAVPDRAAVEAVAPADANRIVTAQFEDFNEYRNKLGATVAAAPAPAAAGQQRAAGRITEKPDEVAASKAPPSDQLRISKADAPAKGSKAAATERADDLAARDRALKDANDRVVQLERNVGDLQKLLELKNQQLADLQKQAQAAAKGPAPKAEASKPAEAPKAPEVAKAPQAAPPAAPTAEAPKAEAPKVEAPVAKAEPPAPPVAEKPAAPPPVAEAPKAPAPVADAAKKAAPAQKAAPPVEPSFIETFLDEPLYPAGVGGGLLAMLVAGYLWRRKKSAKLENSLLGVTTSDSSSVFGTTGGRSVDTGGSSLQTDFSQGGIGAIDTDEVDPIAEADVYMAYGRDAQAEEILKEALQKDPNRQAVRVKLLEIYAARKDLKAFETTAGEIYAATGGQGPEWQKAVELGLQTDPTNPMYGGTTAVASSVPEVATTVTAMAAAATAVPGTTDIALDFGAEQAPASIDFDLEGDTKTAGTTPDITLDVVSQSPADLGFDLNLGDADKHAEEASDFSPSGTFIMDAATKKAVSDMVQAQHKSGALAIDFELPGVPATTAFDQTARMMASQPASAFDFKLDEPTGTTTPGPVDLSGISFDLGQSGVQSPAPVDAQWQEVATKLDLAKAYEEMGDRDGARELLNEVVKEGDSAQQQQAKQMLEALR